MPMAFMETDATGHLQYAVFSCSDFSCVTGVISMPFAIYLTGTEKHGCSQIFLNLTPSFKC